MRHEDGGPDWCGIEPGQGGLPATQHVLVHDAVGAEAIGLLRSIRRTRPKDELIAISGADPLNLAGILSSGPRVPAITAHRILLRDGVPVAALKAGQVIALERETGEPDSAIERALRVGSMAPELRPYYA